MKIKIRTLAMNKPKAPPSAKPIPPEMIVLTGHDSIAACIYKSQSVCHISKSNSPSNQLTRQLFVMAAHINLITSSNRINTNRFDHRLFLLTHSLGSTWRAPDGRSHSGKAHRELSASRWSGNWCLDGSGMRDACCMGRSQLG